MKLLILALLSALVHADFSRSELFAILQNSNCAKMAGEALGFDGNAQFSENTLITDGTNLQISGIDRSETTFGLKCHYIQKNINGRATIEAAEPDGCILIYSHGPNDDLHGRPLGNCLSAK